MTVTLEDYDWFGAQETERAYVTVARQDAEDARSLFERDRARIIHSVAFRRLQGKTQIFAPSSADFLRTRVTHSIEVAQIGRALAQRFRVPGELVEAACLGHDLGHPPFGHTGEDVLADLMKGYGSFEGNAQSFRVVTYLERKDPDYRGLDLCRATLHGLLKYPYLRSADHAKFLYDDDVERYDNFLFGDIDQSFQRRYDRHELPQRTLPCQLMDWADDVAYSVHDLEDGIASGMLEPNAWGNDWFRAVVHRKVVEATGSDLSQSTVEAVIDDLIGRLGGFEAPVPLEWIRKTTSHYINKFANAPTVGLMGSGATLYDFQLEIDPTIRVENEILKAITFEYVIDDARTRRLAFKGTEILRRLFHALFDEKTGNARLLLFPRSMREGLDALAEPETARAVCDYLASMTEGQALALYARLFEPSSSAMGEPV